MFNTKLVSPNSLFLKLEFVYYSVLV